jgi:GGDEF domain-containing protein
VYRRVDADTHTRAVSLTPKAKIAAVVTDFERASRITQEIPVCADNLLRKVLKHSDRSDRMCAWRNNEARSTDSGPSAAERRALGLLLEGAAINLPQIDPDLHRRFRSGILRSSISLVQPQSESHLLNIIASLVHEFETYRTDSEATLDARLKEWRLLTGLVINLLAVRDKIDQRSEAWAKIAVSLATAVTAEEIESLRTTLQKLFQLSGEEQITKRAKEAEEQDRSTANDNAAGLRGGGAAIEHIGAMIAQSRPGYICLFRLSCLDVVGERFGPEGIQDCLMAVSAFLIQNMRAEDSIYHWSESSLLAVCDRKIREDILTAELNRVLARNREFTINIEDRAIMLRIPVALDLFPITQFKSADDLQNLPVARGKGDRTLPVPGSAKTPAK